LWGDYKIPSNPFAWATAETALAEVWEFVFSIGNMTKTPLYVKDY